VTSPHVVTGLAFRHDNTTLSVTPGAWIDAQISMGYSRLTTRTLTNTYANNWDGTPVVVLPQTRVNLPAPTTVNTDPANFELKIPFPAPWPYAPQTGQTLLVELVKPTQSNGTGYLSWYSDAHSDTAAAQMTRLWSLGAPTATTGTLGVGYGVIMGLMSPGGGGAIPQLNFTGAPNIGSAFTLELSQARVSTQAVLLVGISNSQWGQLNLPFDMGGIGAPNCMALASGEIPVGFLVNAAGAASLTINVPNDKSLIQANWFQQVFVYDPPANTLGIVTTNGVRAILGGQP
jgi:hypothetical protein